MSLLLAPFPQNNSSSLAEITLAGMAQLRNELDARTKISQNEQDNWLAESKLAANNLLMVQNRFSDQRDYDARQQQQAFTNQLNSMKLGVDMNEAAGQANYRNAEAAKIKWQMQQPDNPPDAAPGTILGGDAPLLQQGMPGQDIGGAPSLQAPPAGMTSPTDAPNSQPAGNSLLPPVAGSPLLMQNPQMTSEDLAAGAVSGADSAMAAGAAGAAPGLLAPQTAGADTPGLLMQTPVPGAPAGPAAPTSTPPPAPSSATPWINKDGAVDLTKIPYDKLIQAGPGSIVQRQKIGNVDQLQYYKKVEQVQPNGGKKLVTVPDGLPKPIMPAAMSDTPTAVMLPKDKVQAFDTAKFWLDKIFPKMDAKDRQANVPQAMQMQTTLQDLSNDPEVQKHLRSVDNADFAAPAGFSVEGLHYDPKREMMVPTLKKDTPDELKAAANQRSTLRALWDDYKGMTNIVNDSISSQTTKDKAKAKAAGLFQQILKTDPTYAQRVGAAPAAGAPGAPPSAQPPGFFYGQ